MDETPKTRVFLPQVQHQLTTEPTVRNWPTQKEVASDKLGQM